MTGWHECTGFQRDILQAIAAISAEETPYGLALKSWLDERYPDPINHSRLYQNLGTLVEADLIERTAVDERTNAYTLTSTGRKLLTGQAKQFREICRRPVPDRGDW